MYFPPKRQRLYLNGSNQVSAPSSHSLNCIDSGRMCRQKKYSVYIMIVLFGFSMLIVWIGLIILAVRNLPSGQDCMGDMHSVVISHPPDIIKDHLWDGLAMTTLRRSYTSGRKSSTLDKSDPYKILHSLTTRFMIGQPNEPILARARYLLFKTFCHPTVAHQSASPEDFFWFVLADPMIGPDVIDDMQRLLSYDIFPEGNAYMILTNNTSWAADGVGVPGVSSYGASFQEIAKGVRDGNVKLLTGNETRLIRTLERKLMNTKNETTKPLLIIETMLDADDGLNNNAIQWIQDLAVFYTQQQQQQQQQKLAINNNNNNPSLDSTWLLLCGTDHIEWHNRDIFRLSDSAYKEVGLTSGITGIRHAPQYCASAGFTRVGLTTSMLTSEKDGSNYPNNKSNPQQRDAFTFPQKAYSNHALATENFDLCSVPGDYNTDGFTNSTMSRCFLREFAGLPFILKSRSITSDSMDHMDPKRKDYRDLPWESKADHPLLINETERIWRILEEDFSIDRLMAWQTSVYLRENLGSIIEENNHSRCAPGFPCREVADVTFKKMSAHILKMNQ